MNELSPRCIHGVALIGFCLLASPALAAEPASDRGDPHAPSEDASARAQERFRIGVLGGVGFPRPLALEGLVRVERLIGAGVEYSLLPAIEISGARASLWALAGDLRVFPFRDAFFVGLRAGYQQMAASATVTVDGVGSAAVAAEVATTFINPRVGFLWTWEPGIALGVDAGVQLPLGSEVTTDMPSYATGTIVGDELIEIAHDLGQTTVPTIDLLRIGFMI